MLLKTKTLYKDNIGKRGDFLEANRIAKKIEKYLETDKIQSGLRESLPASGA
ncbi:MAG: hypothetical protein HKL88_07000 [Bacteroidia bacterium]|nr:hypothetical protein [Bacteroidia bacterium]